MNFPMLTNSVVVQGQPAVPVQNTLVMDLEGKIWALVTETIVKLLSKTRALTGKARSENGLFALVGSDWTQGPGAEMDDSCGSVPAQNILQEATSPVG